MLNCVLSTSHVTVTHTHNTALIMDGSYSKTTFLLNGSHEHSCPVTGKGKVVQMQIIVKCSFFSSVMFKSCKSTAPPCHVM